MTDVISMLKSMTSVTLSVMYIVCAVSYTHLDVYKRQGGDRDGRLFCVYEMKDKYLVIYDLVIYD